ncbi:cupin domain-containing protein [Halomicrobium salinisoli]|uniref:cupin domain-containing protein n=1 Tax=Halomicrobium salinisoli TaxID=2878391 RepID=UPI001CEFC9E8|nr:cupin domain-containing protein [Halomicrobium salinisoli]
MDTPADLTVGEWDDPVVTERAYEGIERRVLCYDDDAMVVHYAVEAGAVFPEHEHEETRQTVFVIEGEIELFGDRERRLTAGDSFVVGPGVRHGIRGVAERTEIVDTFSPPIEDYRRD